MIHLTEKDYAVSRWSGGTTTQIALFPPESSYAGRDFLWRVSSAVVEDGESAFTPLPDYDRHLMLLEGSLLLRHDGGEPLPLDPYQPHAFDGGAETVSAGRCRDFNLMLRKGKCRGELRPLRFPEAGEASIPLPAPADGLEHAALLLYCARGSGWAALDAGRVPLAAGACVIASGGGVLRLGFQGPGDAVAAAVWY